MGWRRKIESILRNGMRYCFDPLPPQDSLSEVEFKGEEGSMGFLYHLTTEIQALRLSAYKAAYLQGALDGMADTVDTLSKQEGVLISLPPFDPAVSLITAERRFQEWDK